VYAGSGALDIAETVQTSIDTMRRLLGSALALVVIVSDTAESLMLLDGVHGFVRGVRSADVDTAVALRVTSMEDFRAVRYSESI
jgi:hypothetical protein